MLEIEVKIQIEDPQRVRKNLLRSGAVLYKERHFEDNLIWDFPDKSLLQKKSALRLRISGKKAFLTFKGPQQKSRKFKVREEYETEIKNSRQTIKILQSLGYRMAFRYQKHRSVFRTKKLVICLDETKVGNFLELEGDRSDIVRFAEALGYSKKEFIKTDYPELFKNYSSPKDS